MKEKKISYSWIISILVIVVLFIPIIIDFVKTLNIEVVNVDVLANKMTAKESFLVYVGELDSKTKKELRKMRDETPGNYSYEYGVYNVESSKEVKELLGNKTKAALYVEGDEQKVYTKYENSLVEKDVDVYLLANINDKNRSYKVFEDYKEFKNTVKAKETTMIVFGRDDCSYCNKFMPVYNAVANKYDLNIYYFDSNNYDSKEYTKIVNYNLTVPAECSSSGKEFKLSEGFGTPLTIFTKKGKVVDCIGGYVDRATLVNKLKSLKLISE